jgi:DNA transformation protein and related proteins
MPAPIPDFVTYCCELLNAAGRVAPRRMFGGYGLKCDELNVGLIAFDTLYLKVDAQTKDAFAQAGGMPFRYEKLPGVFNEMSYFTVPAEAMESPAEMAQWARLALAAARRAAAGKLAKKAPAKKPVAKKSAAKKPKSAPRV